MTEDFLNREKLCIEGARREDKFVPWFMALPEELRTFVNNGFFAWHKGEKMTVDLVLNSYKKTGNPDAVFAIDAAMKLRGTWGCSPWLPCDLKLRSDPLFLSEKIFGPIITRLRHVSLDTNICGRKLKEHGKYLYWQGKPHLMKFGPEIPCGDFRCDNIYVCHGCHWQSSNDPEHAYDPLFQIRSGEEFNAVLLTSSNRIEQYRKEHIGTNRRTKRFEYLYQMEQRDDTLTMYFPTEGRLADGSQLFQKVMQGQDMSFLWPLVPTVEHAV